MRVALLSYNCPAGDAIGNQVAEKLLFFLERGADIRVFVQDARSVHPSVRNHCRKVRTSEPKGESWEFISSSDLVIVEYSQHYALLELLPLLAGVRPRILFDYHGVTPVEFWGTQNRDAIEQGSRQRGLVWCADAAIAHSQFARQELGGPTGFPAGWMHTLRHPIDSSWFCPGMPSKDLRARLGLNSATILLFVGRLAPNKQVPLLIEAVAKLRHLSPAVHAVIIGNRGDLYDREASRCQELAADLDVSQRVHFLGRVDEGTLRDAYRSADVFVTASRHEGFCIPVMEAMACGLPVVAARGTALPETIGNAGLTFEPDDSDDLVERLKQIMTSRRTVPPNSATPRESVNGPTKHDPSRIAVVSIRYGDDFVGGAETSLRCMATTLRQSGHHVEVFTTCTRSESHWSDDYDQGKVLVDDIPVHRFPITAHDAVRHGDVFRQIVQANGRVSAETEASYLADSLRSEGLLNALRQRIGEFDWILVGPYLFGQTYAIAREFAEKTILVPCFHDEPLARLSVWRKTYREVRGIFFHSGAEQRFAEIELGLNHPGSFCMGSVIDTNSQGDPQRSRSLAETERPYVLYCGRYSAQKNLPLLLDFARRYEQDHPGRFTFAFMGEGPIAIPRESWACNLGFLDERSKRDVLASAAALIQLSTCESLSLTALEAWAEGTPVVGHSGASVLREHMKCSGGGQLVDDYASFAATLDDLWQNPDRWQMFGSKGRAFVHERYGDREAFGRSLCAALQELSLPLAERMRRRGLQRAAQHDRAHWRNQFGEIVEQLLDSPQRPFRHEVEVRPRTPVRRVSAGVGNVLIPVRVINRGSHAVAHEGPARYVLRYQLFDGAMNLLQSSAEDTPLPGILVPQQARSVAVAVSVPPMSGDCYVRFHVARAEHDQQAEFPTEPSSKDSPRLHLIIRSAENGKRRGCCEPLLDNVHAELSEAEKQHRLPDGYLDVTEGFLANWKHWIKQKLLGNFKRGYVDVLSHQQTTFNRHVLSALEELTESCALLDQVAGGIRPIAPASESDSEMKEHLRHLQQRCAVLESRLQQLESLTEGVDRQDKPIETAVY